MSTITIYQSLEYPSPNEQQIRRYAASAGLLVDFQDYDDVQTMFRRVARSSVGIKEIELYKAIMAVEV
jgi:hypothetical protein